MLGKLFGFLFFGVFAAIGLFMLGFKAGPMVVDWVQVLSWQPMQARLISHDMRYGSVEGSTTYQAKARYEYYVGKQKYTARRVGITSGTDNIGSYHKDMYRQLSRVGDKPMTVWVNPKSPNDAIIDRSFRFGKFLFYMFFVVVFGGVGFGGMALVFKFADAGEKLTDSDPDKPWTAYKEWLDPIKKDDQKTANYVGLGFALLWLALTSGSVFAVIANKEWLYLFIVGPFILLGLFLLKICIQSITSYRQTGRMPLSLDPFPASIGGQIGGIIYVDKRVTQAPKNTKVEVQCLRKISRKNSDDNSETKEWHQAAEFDWQMGEYGWQLRFCFDLSDDLSVSSPPLESNGIEWRVKLSAETSTGIKFDRLYNDIPVFATGAQSSFKHIVGNKVAESIKQQHIKLVSEVLTLQEDDRGYRLSYPMFRNWLGVIFAVVGLIFTVIGLNIPDLIFNIVFPLLGFPCFLGGLYSMGNSMEVRIGAEGISNQRALFGFALKPQFLPSFDYKKFKKKLSYSSTSGNEETEYYSILAIGKNKEKVTVALDVEGRSGAQAAIQKLEQLVEELGYVE